MARIAKAEKNFKHIETAYLYQALEDTWFKKCLFEKKIWLHSGEGEQD